MSSRRNFLIKGSMATSALLASKPFTSLANAVAPVTGMGFNDDQVQLVHTGYQVNSQVLKHISQLKRDSGNLLLMHADQQTSSSVPYDITYGQMENDLFSNNSYKIIYKGNIKIGVIRANESEHDLIQTINDLSTWLKAEKNCSLVVCLSSLGYKNKFGLDDLFLAQASTHLDIIISGHPQNFCKQPYIALNKKKSEVVIHHAAATDLALGRIAIDFDPSGKKRNIAFNNRRDATRI